MCYYADFCSLHNKFYMRITVYYYCNECNGSPNQMRMAVWTLKCLPSAI